MLVEEMTQLCGEIRAWRGAREEMLTGLRDEAAGLSRSVSATLGNFRRSRMRLAREAKGGRRAFIRNLSSEVQRIRDDAESLRAGFQEAHATRAEAERAGRAAFAAALRDGIAEFRHDLGRNMAEVRHAWTGRPATRGAHPHSEKRSGGRGMRRTGRSKGKS